MLPIIVVHQTLLEVIQCSGTLVILTEGHVLFYCESILDTQMF